MSYPNGRHCLVFRPALRALLLSLSASSLHAFTCAPRNKAAQCAVLGDLYAATNGAAWTAPSQYWVDNPDNVQDGVDIGSLISAWHTSGPSYSLNWTLAANNSLAADYCTSLPGVSCDANGNIHALNFLGNGLNGTLPASIGTLSNMVSLCVHPRS